MRRAAGQGGNGGHHPAVRLLIEQLAPTPHLIRQPIYIGLLLGVRDRRRAGNPHHGGQNIQPRQVHATPRITSVTCRHQHTAPHLAAKRVARYDEGQQPQRPARNRVETPLPD